MSPRELARLILSQRFGARPRLDDLPDLADFQREAHDRLLGAIARYGGALLADSVGLGKTFVAAAVARSLARPGDVTLAVVPSSLVVLWRGALRGLEPATVITHALLSRSGRIPAGAPRLVIVDEAHAFRNPRTRRYAALARLVAGRSVLMLSATPVNNTVWDLYWLLRLFAADDAFEAVGVPDLWSCFAEAQRTGRAGRIPAVLAAVAVRRSRRQVSELYGPVRVGSQMLRFPSRSPPRPVPYDLPDALRTIAGSQLPELELRPWQDFGPAGSAWLLRLLLLKRLESSATALRASLLRILGALHAFRDALDQGLLLAPAHRGAPARDPAQLALDPLLLRPVPPDLDVAGLRRSAERDVRRLQHCLSLLEPVVARDPKLTALAALLGSELQGRPVLLFSEFRETAEHLWRSLRERVPCALIHGSGGWLGASPAPRRTIIERFAPVANRAPPVRPTERVHLLIATDVLAEGLNLQDAADVVSYDLPWNPVRLVQRLGRIDRLGSVHESVRSWYFVPHRELEQLLRLLQRIRTKLRAIAATVGPEAPVLASAPRPGSLRRLAAGDSSPCDETERLREGMFDIEERLRAAYRRDCQRTRDALDGLPLAAAGSRAPPAEQGTRCPPGARGLYVARLSCPPTLAKRPDRAAVALVLAQLGAVQRAVFVGPRGCHEDDLAAGELLLTALGQESEAAPASGSGLATAVAERAVRWLRRPQRRPGSTSPARRLRARLLRLLQQVPGGPAEADCRQAECIIALLSRPLPIAVETALRPLLFSGPDSLVGLLQALDERLTPAAADGCRALVRPDRTAQNAGVIGVFLLVPGG